MNTTLRCTVKSCNSTAVNVGDQQSLTITTPHIACHNELNKYAEVFINEVFGGAWDSVDVDNIDGDVVCYTWTINRTNAHQFVIRNVTRDASPGPVVLPFAPYNLIRDNDATINLIKQSATNAFRSWSIIEVTYCAGNVVYDRFIIKAG